MDIPLYHKREGYAVGKVQFSDFDNDFPSCCTKLTLVSNKDKHVIENEVRSEKASAVFGLHADGTPHPRPAFLGDKLLVTAGKQPHVHRLPCYYAPYGAFALDGGKWSFFHIVIDQTRLGLMEFVENVPGRVESVINGLEAFM